MKIEQLFEMPKEIEDIDWNDLYDYEKNHKFYLELSANKYKTKIEQLTPFATVWKLNSQYLCLDNNKKALTYYMKYDVKNNGKLGDYVWQSLVWRSSEPYVKAMPTKIFFEKLLHKFGVILTDSEQTWNGKRFWFDRIAEAFEMGLNIYFYDMSGHILKKINTPEEFIPYQYNNECWGNSNKHELKRMIITNKTLPI